MTKLENSIPKIKLDGVTCGLILIVEEKENGHFGWQGLYNTGNCIFAKYQGHREIDPWKRLDELKAKKVITEEQRKRFFKSIANFDHKLGTKSDVENIDELAKILGMEINIK